MDEKICQLQLCELEILDEFVRICEKHGLQYYLAGGTLLGAIRHQGFIPWDDDIDVAMPRKDYECFAEIAPDELNSKYFYQSASSDPCYFLTYNKIRKNGTEVYEERFKNSKFHKGVFIDIFPLDPCPAPGLICHLFFNIFAVMNYRGQIDSGEQYRPYKEISGKIGFCILSFFSPEKLVKLRKVLLRIVSWLSDNEYFASFSGAYGYKKEIYKYCWYGTGELVEFENRRYAAPKDKIKILTHLYGENCLSISDGVKKPPHIDLTKTFFMGGQA